MEFEKLVEQILQEDVVAGGEGSAFGPNVGATATEFSGDTYAPGDARNPHGIYGGVMTRSGMRKKKRSKKRKKSKK
jgi:hypothetical protein